MKKILITGGSGMIGTRLTELLLGLGYEVGHLGRGKKGGKVKTFLWDVSSGKVDTGAFDGVSAIVHLAGANIGGGRWTARRKREILESRTHSTRLLLETLRREQHSVADFISASAIGYYGVSSTTVKIFTENDAAGSDFLAGVVDKWESEVDQMRGIGMRVVKVRVGIVLSGEAGALPEIAKPVKFFVGAQLGAGTQMLSWIHVDDVCRVFIKAIEDPSLHGPVNAVGPEPVSNAHLTKAIARTLGKPLILPRIPEFVIRLAIGEMADLALKGNAVSNEKLVRTGFQYKFVRLEDALDDLLLKSGSR